MATMQPAAPTGDEDNRALLADAVKRRRLELGLSVRAVADKAAIARGTWIALEDGSRRTAESNYARIERALEWAAGSIKSVLAGSEPATDLTSEMPALQPKGGTRSANDEALIRVMGDPRISERDKMRIARILIEERERFERERVAHAEALIRAFRDDES